jgi:hypothetical protein
MADQAVKHPPYISDDPNRDFLRFKDTLRHVVSVPKEAVDKAIAEEVEQKKQRKGNLK